MVPEETEETEPVADREVTVIPSLEELPGAEAGYQSVPRYFQTDYPNHMYGSGTIANNGWNNCGVLPQVSTEAEEAGEVAHMLEVTLP